MQLLMHPSLWFAAGAVAGGVRAFWLLAASRRAGSGFVSLLRWSEVPLPSWKFEPQAWSAILLHDLAMAFLGFWALRAAANPSEFDPLLLERIGPSVWMAWAIQAGSLVLVGYVVGVLVAFPLARLKRTPVAFAVSDEGIIHGRTLLPWRWFSHFSIDPARGVVRLFSAFAPNLPSLVLRPPDAAILEELKAALPRHLPDRPDEHRRRWYRTKDLLVPVMILVCIPFVAAGWLASGLPRELPLLTVVVSTLGLALVGGPVLTLFGFGVVSIRKDGRLLPPAA